MSPVCVSGGEEGLNARCSNILNSERLRNMYVDFHLRINFSRVRSPVSVIFSHNNT